MSSETYPDLLKKIEKSSIESNGFKVEYVLIDSDISSYRERLDKLRDIGYCIEGEPNYQHPSIIYAICRTKSMWYFGILEKHDADWQKHKAMPRKFSNSITINIAKALVSIATKGDNQKRILDACCGVGTVILEACIAGVNIEGCDINWKAFNNTRENLKHYNYSAKLHHSDISELTTRFDAAIIDLPYNLTAYSDDTATQHIISSSAELTDRLVIVSIKNIEEIIKRSGLKVIDICTAEKEGKSAFSRRIWVCERIF